MLVDKYGRPLKSIRLSVTTRCNLRCFYCHNEGVENSPKELSPEDYEFLFKIARNLGIKKLKITGGEPLLRKDLEEIVRYGKKYFNEVSLTTNGTLLAERAKSLKQSGLDRVNISMDSLRRERYREITGEDYLNSVIEGVEQSIKSGLNPVKINVVIFPKINDNEIFDFIEFSRNYGVIVQFIQPVGNEAPKYDFQSLEKFLEANSNHIKFNELHRRKQYYLGGDFEGGIVEVVRPMHNTDFCMNCTRLRVTPDGKLKPCLLRNDYVDAGESILKRDEKSLIDAFIKVNKIRRPFWVD